MLPSVGSQARLRGGGGGGSSGGSSSEGATVYLNVYDLLQQVGWIFRRGKFEAGR